MAPTTSPLVSKIKVHLKLAISRLRIVQQKDTAIAKQQRRTMAQLLEQGRIESAKIRVENIIRSDLITELHEVLELYCELLLARAGLLETQACDPGLEEAVCSIIYAAPRTEIKELQQTRQLFVEKFGKDFAMKAMEGESVPERVTKKLTVEPPAPRLVDEYLKAIAHAYDIKYGSGDEEEDAENQDDDDEPGGGLAEKTLEEPLTTEEVHQMTPPQELGAKSPIQVAPQSPSTENPNPELKSPGPDFNLKPPNPKPKKKPASTSGPGSSATKTNGAPSNEPKGSNVNKNKPGGTIPDVDDLEARFAQLKKR